MAGSSLSHIEPHGTHNTHTIRDPFQHKVEKQEEAKKQRKLEEAFLKDKIVEDGLIQDAVLEGSRPWRLLWKEGSHRGSLI